MTPGGVPELLVDCHAHVFGPATRYPFVEDRRYTPDDAVLDEYRAHVASLGITHTVFSQPSVHGLDNSALVDTVARDPDHLRGVVMVSEDVSDDDLERYRAGGVCGIRTQLAHGSGKPLDVPALRRVARRIAPLGWHCEVHVDVGEVEDIRAQLGDLATDVVVEHMGHMPASRGVDAPGFGSLLRLLRDGRAWSILSGAYINSEQDPPHADVRPYVEALVDAAPDRCVWGTNWPHPHQDPLPDDHLLFPVISSWLGEENLGRVLATNAFRLYEFPTAVTRTEEGALA